MIIGRIIRKLRTPKTNFRSFLLCHFINISVFVIGANLQYELAKERTIRKLMRGMGEVQNQLFAPGKIKCKKKKKRTVHKKNSCGSKIPLPKSPSFNIYLQSQMVNKTLNLLYLTLISTYPSCKTKKGHLRHLHAEAQSEIIQRRNHF